MVPDAQPGADRLTPAPTQHATAVRRSQRHRGGPTRSSAWNDSLCGCRATTSLASWSACRAVLRFAVYPERAPTDSQFLVPWTYMVGESVYLRVDLPSALGVEEGLLGTRWNISLAPTTCTLVLPRRHPTAQPEDEYGPMWPLLAPDVGVDTAPVAEWWEHQHADETSDLWGHYWTPDSTVVNAILNHALVVTRYEGDDEPKVRKAFASELASTIESWLVAVSDWVEVLSGTIISPRRGRPNPDYRQDVPSLRIDRATLRAEIFVPGAIYIDFTERPLVSLSQWTQATAGVAADERPPLAHVLLRDARSARRDQDMRRAVIDAATACEVGLSDSILDGLPKVVSSDEAKAMLKRRNGLMELYDFYVACCPTRHRELGTSQRPTCGPPQPGRP